MTRFRTGALKKTDRSARGNKEGCGDYWGYEGTDRNVLWEICKTLQMSLASLNRWRCRMREKGVLIKCQGPKKVEPFDPSVLDTEIRLLNHGVTGGAGTTDLYRRYRFSLSRRELGQMVERVRQDLESDRRARLRRIEWLTPGVVWAMDGTEYNVGPAGKIDLRNSQDLGSRYKFWPMAGGYPVGEEIAGYLSEKFDRYGCHTCIGEASGEQKGL
jgi:hypothetical protein